MAEVDVRDLEKCVENMRLNSAASAEVLQNALHGLPDYLPSDYIAFMKTYNGGAGFVGDDYLILWHIEEITPFNKEYEVEKYAPGFLFFGSSGGGEAYAFNLHEHPWTVVRIPFIGMSRDLAILEGVNFTEFLKNMAGR